MPFSNNNNNSIIIHSFLYRHKVVISEAVDVLRNIALMCVCILRVLKLLPRLNPSWSCVALQRCGQRGRKKTVQKNQKNALRNVWPPKFVGPRSAEQRGGFNSVQIILPVQGPWKFMGQSSHTVLYETHRRASLNSVSK